MITGNIKYGWHETIGNIVYCHQTSFNIVLIVEQLINNNVELTEKVNLMIAEQNKQRNTSGNNKVNQMILAEAKEFTPNRLDNVKECDERQLIDNEIDMDDKDNKDFLEKRGKGWITPKKHMPIEKSLKKTKCGIKKDREEE